MVLSSEQLLSQWWLPLLLLGLALALGVLQAWVGARRRASPPPLRAPEPTPVVEPAQTIATMASDRAQARNALDKVLAQANSGAIPDGQEDPLTGLMSRLRLEDRLAAASSRAEQRGRQLALLSIDLDGFRAINAQHGQVAGDMVLREVARRLQGIGRNTDALARLAGDQFVMLLDGDPDASAAALVADRVRQSVQRPFLVGANELRLTCSIGIVMHPEHGPKGRLLAHADAALLSAKRAGGNVHCFFEQHLPTDPDAESELQAQLRQALDTPDGGLVLHYQPKVEARRGLLTGVEALLRWQHPVRGLLHPRAFMPMAERYGLLPALSRWVLQESCRQLSQWQAQGLRTRLALNLSRQQLRQPDLILQMQEAFDAHGLSATDFTIEVSEADAMADPRLTSRVFERLHGLGVRLSIDDFGTAQGSVPQLRYLPIVELKIDRRFVQDAESDSDAQAIVKGIVQLAHALDLTVVAEGVESEAQHTLMRRLGCDELQGFRLGHPMAPDDLPQWQNSQGLTH